MMPVWKDTELCSLYFALILWDSEVFNSNSLLIQTIQSKLEVPQDLMFSELTIFFPTHEATSQWSAARQIPPLLMTWALQEINHHLHSSEPQNPVQEADGPQEPWSNHPVSHIVHYLWPESHLTQQWLSYCFIGGDVIWDVAQVVKGSVALRFPHVKVLSDLSVLALALAQGWNRAGPGTDSTWKRRDHIPSGNSIPHSFHNPIPHCLLHWTGPGSSLRSVFVCVSVWVCMCVCKCWYMWLFMICEGSGF